ncbi:MAG TPA: hypothetical protein VGE07_01005 [Herpetosiphonaceae bacterium]
MTEDSQPKKSFYALEMFVEPGGVRECLVFVVASLDVAKRVLDAALHRPFDAYLWACYGRSAWLSAYRRGRLVQEINLLPFIKLVIEDSAPFGFDENGAPRGSNGPLPDLGALREELWDGSARVGGWVDWDRLAVEPLRGPAAVPGDSVTIRSHYVGGEEDVRYGVTETESGLHAEIDLEAEHWGLA